MKNFYIKNKKILNIIFIIFFSIGLLGVAKFCYAQDWNFLGPTNIIEGALLKVLAGIAILIVNICGWIVTITVGAIISITSYNNFINEPDIINGWVIIRDLCNMFFVLVLLVIAFATILRIENYNVKKLLPKLLIMAVLINFSRTIVGLMIDFSQVIMLTFVNSFSDSGGNFIATLKVKEFLSIATDFEGKWLADKDINATNTLAAMFIGIIVMIVSAITMIAILVVFLMRIVMLWIYVVLSPLAFLLSAFPAGAKYASQYWGDLTKYLVNGPVLAFFIWLALITLQNFDTSNLKNVMMTCTTDIMCLPNFIGFIMAIGFLVGGLMISSQIGGIGANWGASAVKGLGTRVGGIAKKGVFGGAKIGTFWAGRHLDTAQTKIQKGAAWLVNKGTLGTYGKDYQAKSLNYRVIHGDWKKSRDEKMRNYEGEKIGAWQDTFTHYTSGSVGIPFASKIRERVAEKQIKNREGIKSGKEEKLKGLQNQYNLNDPNTPEGEANREKIQVDINDEVNGIKNINTEIQKLRKTDWRTKTAPKQKYFRLEQQRRVNEENSNISKEDLDEDGLVDAHENETRIDKKRAYFQHLTDINGINTLMEAKGIKMNSSNIRKMLEKDFGNVAGDVAADMSKRAEMKGNMALVGHAKYDIKSGMGKLLEATKKGDQKQIDQAMKKDKEKYAQNYARTNHFDGLVDRGENGKPEKLSQLGEEQLLAIASNTGRMSEIGKGNFQIRYGNMVVDMADNIQEKINFYTRSDASPEEKTKAVALEGVLTAFQENYAGGGGAKLEKAKGGEKGAEAEKLKEELKKEMEKLKEDLKNASGGIEKSQISNKIKDMEEKIKSPNKKQRKKTESTYENEDND